MMKKPLKGRIVVEVWAICGLCDTELPFKDGSPVAPYKTAIKRGWRHTWRYGWVCAACYCDLHEADRKLYPMLSTPEAYRHLKAN